MTKNISIAALSIFCCILFSLLLKTCSDHKTTQRATIALTDSLTKTVDELGRERSEISNLTLENERMLMDMEIQDSAILWLRETVKDYRGRLQSALVLSNTTRSNGVTNTLIQYKTDSLFPDYTTAWINQWEEGTIIASRDSIYRNIRIKNDYEITIGHNKKSWFKQSESTVSIRNLNPNTVTNEIRSVTFRQEPKKLSLGLQVGYGFNGSGVSPYVGFGLNYNLISIR